MATIAATGCAGIKDPPTNATGRGGMGGGGHVMPINIPEIPGLSGLTVTPESTPLTLMTVAGSGSMLRGTQQMVARGIVNGADQDLTGSVRWTVFPQGANVTAGGLVTVTAPGTFTVTAAARVGTMEYSDTGIINAMFSGDIFEPGFNMTNANKPTLDMAPSGMTNMAYPLERALFPSNLSPIYVHIGNAGAIARLNFQATGVNVNYYAACETGPGGGCYVKMPLSLTQLFIASSEIENIQLRARVTSGSAPLETQVVAVAWAGVPMSGGLYYWSVIPRTAANMPPNCPNTTATPGSYCFLDAAAMEGTAIYRYAFGMDGADPVPQQVWTDDGGPASQPPYQGAPAAYTATKPDGAGHCIGCHAISNDGRYMALTIGGSSLTDGSNFSLLDISMQTLVNINEGATTDPSASPTQNPGQYWREFRKDNIATESAWGPNNDRLVSMHQSQLWMTTLTVNGLTGTVARSGAVLPTWRSTSGEAFATDPFWSQDGTLFTFTSFASPSTGMYNETGLNGDMKKGGQIVIANADATSVHDDGTARVLVPRVAGKTHAYPSISSDSKMVVFNTSTCGSDPDQFRPNNANTIYGNGSCDGYDDGTSQLFIVNPLGGTPLAMTRANGTGNVSNSWPRFSPDKGKFRGQDLYWVGFSSRRAYGMQVNTAGPAGAKPQLWIAGVQQGAEFVEDPSFAPAWLPAQNTNQNTPQGNHVPQWVKVAVIIVQ